MIKKRNARRQNFEKKTKVKRTRNKTIQNKMNEEQEMEEERGENKMRGSEELNYCTSGGATRVNCSERDKAVERGEIAY